jgi:hypothetical protein
LEKELELLGNNRIRLVERIKNLDKEINDKSTDIIYTLEKKEQREKKIEELGEKEIELNSFLDDEELNKMEEETFENFFPVNEIIKYSNVNSVNYKPFLEGA